MKRTRSLGLVATAAVVALLAPPLAHGVGTGGTGLRVYAHGALNRVGGVVVKGITFDPSQATITINGKPHSADDLLPGMVAGVDGDVVPGQAAGVARSIKVTRVVLAPVTDFVPGAITQVGTGGTGLRIRLAGISVNPRYDAVIAGCASLADITIGTTLDVYGYSDGILGTVDATRIECVGPSGTVELHGVASAIALASIVVQGVAVDTSSAQFVGFVMPIAAGDRVEVEGTATAQGISATTVTFEPDADSSNGEDVEVEDAISAMMGSTVFVVDSFTVDATSAHFSNGNVADLAVGRVVHVEGTVVNGILNAKSVEFDDDDWGGDGGSDPPSGTETDDVDGGITAFTSLAKFVVDGVTVDASAATIVNGVATDLAVGRNVKVLGTRTGSLLKATKVTFVGGSGGDDGAADDDGHHSGGGGTNPGTSKPPSGGGDDGRSGPGDGSPAGGDQVEGRVETLISPGIFTVGNVTVDARNARISGGSVANIRAATKVQATGSLQAGMLVATRVEIDD